MNFGDFIAVEVAKNFLLEITKEMKQNIDTYSERELTGCYIVIDSLIRIVDVVTEEFFQKMMTK